MIWAVIKKKKNYWPSLISSNNVPVRCVQAKTTLGLGASVKMEEVPARRCKTDSRNIVQVTVLTLQTQFQKKIEDADGEKDKIR